MNKGNIETIKKIELELLNYVIEICHRQELIYYLAGGTCLGAVRHKGFIPWDDDIDVIMPRPDYDSFISIAQDFLPPHLFLQTYDTDPKYVQNFAKLRNSNTTFIETSCSKLHINHGIYIDIFPLDGGGDSYDAALENLNNIEKANRRINVTYFFPSLSKVEKIKLLLKKVIYCFGPSVNSVVRKRDEIYKHYQYDHSSWVANYGGAWGKKEIMPKSVFGIGTEGEFEGIKVMLPHNYDEYLTRLYNDYMTPPPKEQRVGHHYCTIIDPFKSYKEYLGG